MVLFIKRRQSCFDGYDDFSFLFVENYKWKKVENKITELMIN